MFGIGLELLGETGRGKKRLGEIERDWAWRVGRTWERLRMYRRSWERLGEAVSCWEMLTREWRTKHAHDERKRTNSGEFGRNRTNLSRGTCQEASWAKPGETGQKQAKNGHF